MQAWGGGLSLHVDYEYHLSPQVTDLQLFCKKETLYTLICTSIMSESTKYIAFDGCVLVNGDL